LVDLRPKKTHRQDCQESLDQGRHHCEQEPDSYDPEKPLVTSGIRLGTPAVTTRGMKEAEMQQIAAFIAEVLEKPEDAALQLRVKGNVPRPHRPVPVTLLNKLCIFVGMTILGWVGWWLGNQIGLVTAYVVSGVGSMLGSTSVGGSIGIISSDRCLLQARFRGNPPRPAGTPPRRGPGTR